MNQITYDTYVIQNTTANVPTECNSIRFENRGDVDAVVLNNIPLPAGDYLEFENEDSESMIKKPMNLIYDVNTSGVNPSVLIIRKYVKPYTPASNVKNWSTSGR